MKPTSVMLLFASSLLFTACYGAAPPRPAKLTLPPLSDDAQLVVHSETKTTYENVPKTSSTCPSGVGEGHPSCTVHRYDVVEPVTRTKTHVTYGGEPVTYGQFMVMTDDKYEEKLSRLDELAHKCKRANVPRYVGIGLLLGGVTLMVASQNSGAVGLAGWGALAGGGVSYGFGYYGYGGRQCNQARALYVDLDMSEESTWESVGGRDRAAEMKRLAEQFNAMRGRPTSALQMR